MSGSRDFDGGAVSDEEREILAYLLEQERQAGLKSQQILPRRTTQPPPLSFAQQRLWILQQMADTGAAYNWSIGLQISGPLRRELIARCLDEIVRRHEVLRSTVGVDGEQPFAVVRPPAPVEVEFFDLGGQPPEQAQEEARRLLAEVAATRFDLVDGPLLRFALLRVEARRHLLVLCMHHMVSDGWSMGVLLRELATLYQAYLDGKPSPLDPLPVQYADFALWQRGWLAGDELQRQLDYWRGRLDNCATLELPTDKPRPALPSFKGAHQTLVLGEDLKRALVDLAQREGVTLFMLGLSVFKLLLHRYSGQHDIVLGSPVANRDRLEVEGLIGFFVNMLVLRSDLSGNPGFRELLARVRRTVLDAFEHQDLPFEKLVDELHIKRDMSRNPLFQVTFAVEEKDTGAVQLAPGLDITSVPASSPAARFDLEFFLTELEQGIRVLAVYDTDLFDAGTIERMLGHYRRLLEQVALDAQRPIGELELLDAQERARMLVDWNRPHDAATAGENVCELFAARVRAAPDALALEDDGGRLSYAQLDRAANRLAHYLVEQGVAADVPVMVLMQRRAELVVAQLAVLKAGGAYVPIDPDYPAARLAYILADSATPVLLTETGLLHKVADYRGQTLCLDAEPAELEGRGSDDPGIRARAGDLAYVIYTSGSTGEPKGVEIEHRGLANLVAWHRRAYEVTPADRATHLAGLGFDASVWELWPYLCAGASVHLVADEVRLAPGRLWPWMAARGITLSFLPTPLAEAALREPLPADLRLRLLLTGGDRLHGGLCDTALPFRLFNHYGPSENSVVATVAEVDPAEARDPPIGRPIDNVSTYVLDPDLQPVPVGVQGELFIGGAGVARGYLKRPELSAEKFLPDPFDDDGGRLYRSGDIVRYRADGVLEFIGRADEQVKLRGYRIELGEIEAQLKHHPGVDSCVVELRADGAAGDGLVAYLVAGSEPAPEHSELREFLRQRLPEYMLPAAFVTLQRWPLSASGKIDRKALPQPQPQPQPRAAVAERRPRTEMEASLAQVWEELLEIDGIEADDMFFDLGGHSMLTIKVIDRFEQETGIRIPVASFMTQTLRQIAAGAEATAQAAAGNGDDSVE